MAKKLEYFAAILIVLFGGQFVHAQDLASNTLDSISTSVPAKKAIEITPFQLIDPDTITLGEHDKLISDSYTALGQRYVYDALHSFNSRKMDHFGGYLNVKINEGLAEIRQQGFNSDVKKLYIQIDPATLTVHWTAVVGPSTDGKCCVAVDSRGSAGGGLPAVLKQCPRMHGIHDGLKPEILLEFNHNVLQCYDWNGAKLDSAYGYVNIQQHFYKYYDPQIGTTVTLADYAKQEAKPANTATSTAVSTTVTTAPAVATAKKAPATTASYRKYKVKSGDTLSQIAEKYHTSVAKIKKANGLRSDMLQIGQNLKIPY